MFGIRKKLKKVSHGNSIVNNQIFRCCKRLLDLNQSFTNMGKRKTFYRNSKQYIQLRRHINFAINTITRSSIIHHTSISCSNSLSLPPASKSVSSEKTNVSQRENCSKQSSISGIAMVDRKPKEVSNPGQTSNNYKKKYFTRS